jgi:hypothetical protein
MARSLVAQLAEVMPRSRQTRDTPGRQLAQAAGASFPLVGWLGGACSQRFPVAPWVALVATTTGGLMLAATTVAAFAGVVADRLRRALGCTEPGCCG